MFKIASPRQLILILILASTASILRIVRLPELFHFTYDESVFAFIGKQMFINGHIPLIGGVTPFHVHLSPYFYWLSGFLLFLSKLDPLGWGYFSAIISGITIILLYIFVKDNFSARIATISIVLYTFSLYSNAFDRHYWGLYFNPLLTVITLISLTKIIKNHNKYYLILGSALSFGFHSDLSTLVLLLLTVVAVQKYKIPIFKNNYGKAGLLIFIASFIPLLLFDIRHDFVNIKGLFSYQEEVKASVFSSSDNKISYLLMVPNYIYKLIVPEENHDLADFYSYCSTLVKNRQKTPLLGTLTGIAILLIVVYKFKNKTENNVGYELIFILTIIVFLGIALYSGIFGRPFFDHYISTLLPLGILYTGIVLSSRKFVSNKLLFLLLAVIILTNTLALKNTYHSYGYKIKRAAVAWAIQNVSGEFSLDSLSTCHKYNGYRFIFLVEGKEPVKSYVDANFFWLFDTPPASTHPPEVVVMVAKDYRDNPELISLYQKYSQYVINKKTFGSLEVLIVDNTHEIIYDF